MAVSYNKLWNLVRQNKTKQVTGAVNTGVGAALSTAGLLTGTSTITTALGDVLGHVTPVDLVAQHCMIPIFASSLDSSSLAK